ncbi:sensor histidine kinase [Aeromicrobium fastidiosum]|uniref:histidine kinase n=1 Tax=Aeromicrobium fastidiosum TaxID=52699 RepID=A0A641ANY5_9ACTN|nr:HAMP domain-containing sensor histidine kinase [Aeromicrobium fastidiosum]KAA1378097.1 HAMP domain-containing histidine kinase [Aeromicrobium fastidiosum]MBP2389107.1 signal transduction histidine kinase [Aeromicrobium fastidiosum]
MEPSPVRDRVPDPAATHFGESVFRSQVLLTGAVGFVICITVALSKRDLSDSPAFFIGITAILWVTIAAALVPWLRMAQQWQMVVPLLDIAALGMLRIAVPDSGFGILMIFPVIWLATSFGRWGAVSGAGLGSAMLVTQTVLIETGRTSFARGTTSPIATTSLAVALTFVAGVLYTTSQRVSSQRVLLRRQTRMLEAALGRARTQELTLREALDAVEFAVINLDPDGRTLTANRATHALLFELGLPVTTTWDRFPLYRSDKVTPVPPAEFPHVRLLAGEAVGSTTYWIGHRTGTRFAVDVSARLMHDHAGQVDRIVVVVRDVSAEVRAIADRDDLVTSMSHELRTPLSSMLGYVDLALETDLPQATRDMLQIALTNAERLNALVTDLLAARSTSPANAITLSPAPYDVSALVSESVDAIRPMSAERLISIHLDIDDGVEAEVDAFRLRQVVDNLLSNAIKYNRIGGRITISVAAVPGDDADGTVEIRVADTGRGMSLEEQKGLFERFYRAESVRGSTVHGTGLGLSISREIVVLHGGTIEVDSEPGRGTEVVVRVPRRSTSGAAASHAPPALAADSHHREA